MDHSLFMAGGGLVKMRGGGVTQNSRQFEGGHGKYANRCVRGSPAI